MKNLNSILIEGSIYNIKKNIDAVSFVLKNDVGEKKINGELFDENIEQIFNVYTTFSTATVKRLSELKERDEIRVVGRLEAKDSGIFIKAEHIEVKYRF